MKVQNPIIGRAKGLYGGGIFYTLLGFNVARSKPLVVKNPRTLPQQKNRARLSIASLNARKLRILLQSSFKEGTVGMYPRNRYMQVNKDVFQVNDLLEDQTTYKNLKVAIGSNCDPATNATAVLAGGDITISYTPGSGNPATSNKLEIVAWKSSTEQYTLIQPDIEWSEGELVLEDTDFEVGDVIHIYAKDTVTGLYSDSIGVPVTT